MSSIPRKNVENVFQFHKETFIIIITCICFRKEKRNQLTTQQNKKIDLPKLTNYDLLFMIFVNCKSFIIIFIAHIACDKRSK